MITELVITVEGIATGGIDGKPFKKILTNAEDVVDFLFHVDSGRDPDVWPDSGDP